MDTCLALSRRAIILVLWLALLFGGQPAASLLAQEATPVTPAPVPPAEIPEPITVILFGAGLAALSAASALRRKKDE